MSHNDSQAIADKMYTIPDADPRFTLRRRFTHYAYPQNGNVHRPTPYFRWDLLVDGVLVDGASRKRDLVDAARNNGEEYLAEIDAR